MGGSNRVTDVWNKTIGNKGIGGAVGRAADWVGDRFKTPNKPKIDQAKFDIGNQAAKYTKIANEQAAKNRVENQKIADMLQARVDSGPTLANAQLRAAQEQNLAQTLAAAAAQRKQSPLAQRQAMNVQQAGAQNIAQQNMAAALQERQQAQALQQQQMARQAQTGIEDINAAFNIAYSPETLRNQMGRAQTQADLARSLAIQQQQQQILGSVIGGLGQVGAAAIKAPTPAASPGPAVPANIQYQPQMPGPYSQLQPMTSDEKQKENKTSAKEPIADFLDKLVAMEYDYKNPNMAGAAHGRRYGIMAQDLEKSEVGKSLVLNTPEGKKVDTAQGFGAVLAAQSELNRRIKKLEGRKKDNKA